MTTKYKIISGFGLLIVLMVVMGTMGYRGMQNANGNFNNYDWVARLNVLLSDMTNAMSESALHMNQFMLSVNDADMNKAMESVANFVRFSEEAVTYIKRPERVTQMKQIMTDMDSYKKQLEKVRGLHKGVHASYSGKF